MTALSFADFPRIKLGWVGWIKGWGSVGASDLLDDDIDFVAVLHVEFLGGLGLVETFAVEEEADVGGVELRGGEFTLWRWQ